MKKGFTLAEVLITLAIIGVVAALTIPVVVNNYQKKAQYTAFMKMYNTITNALSLAQGEYGSPSSWDVTVENDDMFASEFFKKYLIPYLKVGSVCEQDDIDTCYSYDMQTLSGSDTVSNTLLFKGPYASDVLFLQDGSALVSALGDGFIVYAFDTNGKKGPNVAGRDIFYMMYMPDANGNWKFFFDQIENVMDLRASECDPSNSNALGYGCPARLLQEGKMNY